MQGLQKRNQTFSSISELCRARTTLPRENQLNLVDEQEIKEIIDFGVKTIENPWKYPKCLLRFLRDYWELAHKLDIWDY